VLTHAGCEILMLRFCNLFWLLLRISKPSAKAQLDS
jgi:hypothetical protein